MGGEKQNSLCLILLLCFITGTSANKCFLPNEPGPCDYYFLRWFYNRMSYQCEEFIYGGCGGNGNRFSTLEECQTTCIACGPECEMYCPYGKVMDSQGCPLCECNPCGPECEMYCPYGKVMDSQGCPLCECNPCGPECDMYCPYGKVLDSQGCALCECNPCGPECAMYCPYGKVMDSQGCPLCECNPCGPECEMYCPYGKVMDSQGCPLCECNPCGPECEMYCQYGKVMDSQGCPLCECNPCGPVCEMYCPYGNVMDSQGCPLCECNPANTCFLPKKPGTCTYYFPMWFYNPSSFQCEEFIYSGCGGNGNRFSTLEECQISCTDMCGDVCTIACNYGNVLDSQGCPTCVCNPANYPPPLGADSNNGCRPIDDSIVCKQYLEQCKSDTACQGRMGGCAKCCEVECGTECQRTDIPKQ